MEADPLNTLAVIVGAIAGFVLGAILYHPKVLGTRWATGVGIELTSPPAMAFVLQIIALLSLALVIGLTATVHFLGTALLAILAAVLFVAASGIAKKHGPGAYLTDALYVGGSGALMILCQGLL